MNTVRQRWLVVVVAATAAIMFAGLSLAVARGATDALDAVLHGRLFELSAAHGGLLTSMHAVTHLGDPVTYVTIDSGAIATCPITRRPRTAVIIAAMAISAWPMRIVVRDVVDRPRPTDAFWAVPGPAFPSGHATNSATTAALVLIVIWPWLSGRTGRTVATSVSVTCVVAVGFSRLVGGVHWPTDVLGGWLLAAAVVAGALACPRLQRLRQRDGVPATDAGSVRAERGVRRRSTVGGCLEFDEQRVPACRRRSGRHAPGPAANAPGRRAVGWLEHALAPLRDTHPHIDVHELAVAIRSATGVESLIWLRDIAGQGPAAAARTVRRTAQALLDAALSDTSR